MLGYKSKDNALLTLVERKTRMEIIRSIPSKDASAVTAALNKIFHSIQIYKTLLKVLHQIMVQSSVSWQGGRRNHKLRFTLHTPMYRGGVGSSERHNGLIRKIIKKEQPIHAYTDELINNVENWMNRLLRKILNYQTSEKAIGKFINCVD